MTQIVAQTGISSLLYNEKEHIGLQIGQHCHDVVLQRIHINATLQCFVIICLCHSVCTHILWQCTSKDCNFIPLFYQLMGILNIYFHNIVPIPFYYSHTLLANVHQKMIYKYTFVNIT